MSAGKEILTKIKSVENTKKITKVMEMVARSKMYKTQSRMKMARPYAEVILDVIAHLATSNMEYIKESKILIKKKSIKKVGFIFITTDKGLCGGLNANLTKLFLSKIKEFDDKGIKSQIVCLGSKGLRICNKIGLNVVSSAINLGDTPKMESLLGSINVIFNKYFDGDIDAVYLIYSKFINSMKQEPNILPLLPIDQSLLVDNNKKDYNWDYIYEPNAVEVLDYLIKRYLESEVYHALCDNMASEQSSRMVAMKAATDNATNAIKDLRLAYNKSRQAMITKELSEIVSGASAV